MIISVAIASYNGAKFIKQQLLSIYNQTEKVDEVIICDDCSTDNTVEICNQFIKEHSLSNWTVKINEKNLGYCLNFYGAINSAIGDVIFIADQDDVWHNDKVEKMLKCLNDYPDIYVLSSRYDVIDANSKIIENSGVTYLGSVFDNSVEYLTSESFIGCSYIRGFSICMKAKVKELMKPIDLKSILSHDWFICFIGTIIGKTAILNTKLTDYRYHLDNVSLSDMTRKTLIASPEKRINGLVESINGHTYLTEIINDNIVRNETLKFIEFEKLRLKFLKNKNLFLWIYLLHFKKEYSRYYKGNGLRVWLGDFAYAFKINFKIKK